MNNKEVCKGKWTREDSNGSKSILDLVIANHEMIDCIEKIQIDEQHEYKISRLRKINNKLEEKKSDHNTILVEITKTQNKQRGKNIKERRWNIKNEKAWERYREETEKMKPKEDWKGEKSINKQYKRWTAQIKSIMYKCLDRITSNSKITNNKIKTTTKRRKEVSKEVTKLRNQGINKGIVHDYLMQKLQELKLEDTVEIHQERMQRLRKKMEELASKTQVTNEIWNIRKRYSGKNEAKLAVKDGEGNLLVNTEQIHRRYEEYYKDLLKPREIPEEYKKHSKVIQENHEKYKQITKYDKDEMNQPFTMKEMETVIRELRKEKSPGSDELYNELIIHAGKNLKQNLLEMLNTFWMKEELPDELYKVDIKSIYKGKGEVTNLANQRGLFLSSAILKFYEKMIMIRGGSEIQKAMTPFQAGGRPKYSTAEQTFILRSILENHKYYKRKLILQFYDLMKAFDKMIIKNIMQELWENGIRGRIWRNMHKINEKAVIQIRTALGKTEKFEIGETLKQGSVLASTLAAFHTDKMSKIFKNTGLGVYYGQQREIYIPCLLFQDDVIKFDTTKENMQKSNIILQEHQIENGMKFHETKTVVMANNKQNPKINLNNKKVPEVKEYKYLGDIVTIEGDYTELINERGRSISGTVAELVSISGEIKQYNIKASIQYLNGIIIPKLLVNAEAWNLKKKDLDNLERIQSQSIKRLLHLPYSTPTRGLVNELGMMTIENRINMRKLIFLHKILNKGEDNLAKRVLKAQIEEPGKTWVSSIKELLDEIEISETMEEIADIGKSKWRSMVAKRIWKREQLSYYEWADNSKKCSLMRLDKIKIKDYIEELAYEEARIVMQVRLGMVDVKTNFKNKHKDTKCRNCQTEEENTEHFIECLTPEDQKYKISNFHEFWSLQNKNNLQKIASHTLKVLKENTIFEYKG